MHFDLYSNQVGFSIWLPLSIVSVRAEVMASRQGLMTLTVVGLLQAASGPLMAQRVHTQVGDAERIAQQTGRPLLAIAGAKT